MLPHVVLPLPPFHPWLREVTVTSAIMLPPPPPPPIPEEFESTDSDNEDGSSRTTHTTNIILHRILIVQYRFSVESFVQ